MAKKKTEKKTEDAEVEHGKEAARKVLTPAEVEALDVEAIRRIARASLEVERVEGDLAVTRRTWNEKVARARANVKATIEAAGGATTENAKARLDQILEAQQQLDEDEAGRKMELHEALTQKKNARRALRKAFDGARQLDLPETEE